MWRALAIGVLAGVLGPATAAAQSPPPGATARCNDGTYSYSQHHQGTCSHHGGVAEWLDGSRSVGVSSPPAASKAVPSPSHSSSAVARAKAKTSFLSVKQSHYDERGAVTFLSHPPSGLAPGLQVAATARYRDTSAEHASALVGLYVYDSEADALAAYNASCPSTRCSKSAAGAKFGVSLRFRAWASPPGHCVRLSSLRGAIVVLVDTCAYRKENGQPYGVPALKYDAGFMAGGTQGRAAQAFK